MIYAMCFIGVAMLVCIGLVAYACVRIGDDNEALQRFEDWFNENHCGF